MKIQKFFSFALIILILGGIAALPFATHADTKLAIGEKMDNFTLSDASGKQNAFAAVKGKNGTVVIFLSVMCPVVNRFYKDRIAALAKNYQAKGVNIVGLNANSGETMEQIKANAEERAYAFPVLIDKGNIIADKLGANVTPEVFLFDKDDKLVYRGAIDNDRTGEKITANYLRDAVDATLAGKTVAKTETASFGCGIKRVS